mmetsp:Transcript_44867/g.145776  ORF Transcript_44867/g.145776 Transcript_44867/m.145776 type:complete len:204 (+) Transcript_44867:433-1044(+)
MAASASRSERTTTRTRCGSSSSTTCATSRRAATTLPSTSSTPPLPSGAAPHCSVTTTRRRTTLQTTSSGTRARGGGLRIAGLCSAPLAPARTSTSTRSAHRRGTLCCRAASFGRSSRPTCRRMSSSRRRSCTEAGRRLRGGRMSTRSSPPRRTQTTAHLPSCRPRARQCTCQAAGGIVCSTWTSPPPSRTGVSLTGKRSTHRQ